MAEAGGEVGRASEVTSWLIGGPKMMAWSSTKEEMSGAGTLRVGAKTMPTMMGPPHNVSSNAMIVSKIFEKGKGGGREGGRRNGKAYRCARSSC